MTLVLDLPPQLDYGPRTPWHRRKKIRRRIILLLYVVVAVFAGVSWGPQAWHRVHVYWAQWQCLNYVAPQGQLIYATAPGDPFSRSEANAFRQPAPACWVTLGANLPDPLPYPNRGEWTFSFDPLAPAPVFLHRRMNGSKTRFVVVQFGQQGSGGKGHRVLCCRVIYPATLFHGPALLWEQGMEVADSSEWRAAVRVIAGRIDGSDNSHFTIDMTVGGQPRILDGWLQNDDTLKMQVSDGPAKKP